MGQLEQSPRVEFCAAIADEAVPLGMKTNVVYFVWNKTPTVYAYALDRRAIPTFHRCDFDIIGGHCPSMPVLPGEFVLGFFSVPFGCGFSDAAIGVHEISLSVELSSAGGIDGRRKILTLAIEDAPFPPYLEAHWNSPADVPPVEETFFTLKLSDEYLRTVDKPPTRSGAAPYSWNERSFQNALRDFYDLPPPPHRRFGATDDWTHDRGAEGRPGLLADLDAQLSGCYKLSEDEYNQRYVLELGQRVRFGLSPYYSLKRAIQMLHEHDRDEALAYLMGLETERWNCVDHALFEYVKDRIAGWEGTGPAQGLVYTREMAGGLVRDADGCLRAIANSPIDSAETGLMPTENGVEE